MKKILGVSLVAMMAVTTARAEIASKAYVDVSGTHPYVSASSTAGANIGALADAIGSLPATGTGSDAANIVGYVDAKTAEVAGTAGNAVVANTDPAGGIAQGQTSATHTKITYDSKGLVTNGADITLSDVTDVTATAAEVNVLDGITATTAELNILDGVTADASELNILDGATLTTTELNYVDGVTSSIQTQLDAKQAADNIVTETTVANLGNDANSTTKYPSMATAQAIATAAATSATANGLTTSDKSTEGVANNETGLVTGDQVYDYIDGLNLSTTYQAKSDSTVANGTYNYITQGSGVAANLIALDTNLKTVEGAAGNAVKSVEVNGTALRETDGAVNVTVATGTTNGTVAVNGTDVAVKVPAFTSSTAGEYVLTASVDASGNPTYYWELISRTGSETDQSVRAN